MCEKSLLGHKNCIIDIFPQVGLAVYLDPSLFRHVLLRSRMIMRLTYSYKLFGSKQWGTYGSLYSRGILTPLHPFLS